MADHFHSIINDENDVSISKDSTKPEPSNSKRRKKKALSAINQNVVMNNLGNEKTYNWRPQAIRSDEVYADRELDSKISDSESSLPKQSKGNSTRNRTSTSVHSVNHEQQEKTNSRGQNDSLKDKEARRLRVVLTEKDRQLASLHHMVFPSFVIIT